MERASPTVQTMLAAAREAAEKAYVPYSGFRVGAAVLTAEGEVFSGCNVENASYSLTICAERSALFHAIGAGHRGITAIVIFAESDRPAPPCGACRQVMAELAPEAKVFSFSASGACLQTSVPELLPFPFSLDP